MDLRISCERMLHVEERIQKSFILLLTHRHDHPHIACLKQNVIFFKNQTTMIIFLPRTMILLTNDINYKCYIIYIYIYKFRTTT